MKLAQYFVTGLHSELYFTTDPLSLMDSDDPTSYSLFSAAFHEWCHMILLNSTSYGSHHQDNMNRLNVALKDLFNTAFETNSRLVRSFRQNIQNLQKLDSERLVEAGALYFSIESTGRAHIPDIFPAWLRSELPKHPRIPGTLVPLTAHELIESHAFCNEVILVTKKFGTDDPRMKSLLRTTPASPYKGILHYFMNQHNMTADFAAILTCTLVDIALSAPDYDVMTCSENDEIFHNAGLHPGHRFNRMIELHAESNLLAGIRSYNDLEGLAGEIVDRLGWMSPLKALRKMHDECDNIHPMYDELREDHPLSLSHPAIDFDQLVDLIPFPPKLAVPADAAPPSPERSPEYAWMWAGFIFEFAIPRMLEGEELVFPQCTRCSKKDGNCLCPISYLFEKFFKMTIDEYNQLPLE